MANNIIELAVRPGLRVRPGGVIDVALRRSGVERRWLGGFTMHER